MIIRTSSERCDFMNSKRVAILLLSAMAIFSSAVFSQDQVVVESAQEIPSAYNVDVVVYGATPGGISAAAAAAREGKSVLLVEHMSYLGGLLGVGFSMYEDMPFRETLGGITGWWYDRTSEYKSAQNRIKGHRDLAEEMLSPYADKIQILTEHRVRSVTMDGDRIVSIMLEHAKVDEYGIPAARPTPDKTVVAKGRVFIDASYEGDVMAMADVSYHVGRESAAQYGESLAMPAMRCRATTLSFSGPDLADAPCRGPILLQLSMVRLRNSTSVLRPRATPSVGPARTMIVVNRSRARSPESRPVIPMATGRSAPISGVSISNMLVGSLLSQAGK